jgi:hypothetical protein
MTERMTPGRLDQIDYEVSNHSRISQKTLFELIDAMKVECAHSRKLDRQLELMKEHYNRAIAFFKRKTHKKWNEAADYVINSALQEEEWPK